MDKTTAVRKACKINDEAFRETLKNFSQFKTERDLANFLNREIKKRSAKLAFPTIVANAAHAYELHHKPCKKKLSRGFVVIDFGAKVAGYCSDMTRTIFIGTPSNKERELYNLVQDAQNKCVKMSKPGVICSEIDHYATILLGKYGPNFIHWVGHGIDKEVHAKPNIGPRSAAKLQAGEIIAIEPGIYIKKKLGIRIEDTVLVKNKPVALTKFTKKLLTF